MREKSEGGRAEKRPKERQQANINHVNMHISHISQALHVSLVCVCVCGSYIVIVMIFGRAGKGNVTVVGTRVAWW